MEESPPSCCRLCLTTFSDSDQKDRLLDVFRDEENHFALKIRECTGVLISEEDSLTTVCVNCVETVHLLAEFRNLCRQSEEWYGDFVTGTKKVEDLERWEAYRHHVGELRKLLPGDSPENFFKPMVMVKQEQVEEEEQDQDDDMGFEWADTEDLLEIKHEVDEEEGEDDFEEEEEEDVPKRKKVKVEPEVDQLTLAKEIKKFPALWDASHKGFHQASLREQAWKKLASETGLDKAHLKREFNRLHDIYRRKSSSTDVGDELTQLLESMFSSRKVVSKVRGSSKSEEDGGTDGRLRLARIVYDHEAIWNKNHDEYENVSKWKKAAKEYGVGVEELKRQWKALRDLYHARRRRILAGTVGSDHPLFQEPLHVLLEEMLAGNTNPKTKPVTVGEEVVTMSGDERLKLTELIFEKDIIWNRGNPLHNDSVRRDEAFAEVADQLKLSVTVLKTEWRKLRNLYRLRTIRLMEGKITSDSSQLNDSLYLQLKKMLQDNMDVGKRSTIHEPAEEVEESSSTSQHDRLTLVQAFYEREVIWNRAHPMFRAPRAREEAYQELAEHLQMSVPELRNQWKSLRDGHRVRKKRLLANPDDESAIHATFNPVHLLMDQMSQEVQTFPSVKGQPKLPAQPFTLRRKRNCPNADLRLTIANAIHEHEILWNRSHPHFSDQEKRETIWEQLATNLNLPLTDLKQQWKLLRDLYRGRFVRVSIGKISPNHPFLKQPLYRVLNEMLRDNMEVGKMSNRKPLKRLRRQQLAKRSKGEEDGKEEGVDIEGDEVQDEDDEDEEEQEDKKSGKPFEDPEMRARLAEEIKKNELLWNVNHVDYSRGTIRGQVWAEIAAQFGLDRSIPINTWRLASHRHRRLREVYGSVGPELLEKDPLHRMLHEVVYGGTDAKDGTGDDKAPIWPPKRRYTGKKVYSDEGCIKVMHNGTPHYFKVCELCGKNVERSDFEYHMNRHNGLTPYACSYEGCDKRYASKITRDRHEVLVHTAAAERFECDQCGEKFKYRSKLDYHIAVHHQSQYHPCPVCGKDLKHKQALRNHMHIHTQSHPCPICGRVLQKKHSLDVHMRIHTNEKPFPCELCGQNFRIKVLLKTHLSRVHNVALEELEAVAGPSGSGM